ncbi:hypothetical protein JCM18750_35370 [Halostagnicola bangensis]
MVVNEKTGKTKVPKEDYPEMVHGQKDEHSYGYEYATLSIVGRNAPIVIAVEPVRRNSGWEGDDGKSMPNHEIVDRLMEQATQHVDIHKVMADREFDSHGVQDILDQWGVTYLIPKKKYEKDLEDIEKVEEHPVADAAVLEDVPLHIDGEHSHDVNFMFVPSRNKKFATTDGGDYAVFITNRDEVSPDEAMGLTSQYSRRWDIENGYKSIKSFLPSIASTDYRMRCFSFIFGVLLYNLWRMVDHLVKVLVKATYDDYEKGDDEIRLKPLVTSSGCIETFLDGFDPPD